MAQMEKQPLSYRLQIKGGVMADGAGGENDYFRTGSVDVTSMNASNVSWF